MTRFVTGEEITEISGAIAETFIKERRTLDRRHGRRHRRGRRQRAEQDGPSHRRRHRPVPRPLLRRRRGQLRGRPPGHRQPEPQRLRDQRHEGLAQVRLRTDERAASTTTPRAPRRAGLDHHHVHPRRRPPLRRPTGGPTPTSSATSTASPTRPTTSSACSPARSRPCRSPTSRTPTRPSAVLEAALISAAERRPVALERREVNRRSNCNGDFLPIPRTTWASPTID